MLRERPPLSYLHKLTRKSRCVIWCFGDDKPIIYPHKSNQADYRDSGLLVNWIWIDQREGIHIHSSGSYKHNDCNLLSFCHLQFPNSTDWKREYDNVQYNCEDWYKYPIFQIIHSGVTNRQPHLIRKGGIFPLTFEKIKLGPVHDDNLSMTEND